MRRCSQLALPALVDDALRLAPRRTSPRGPLVARAARISGGGRCALPLCDAQSASRQPAASTRLVARSDRADHGGMAQRSKTRRMARAQRERRRRPGEEAACARQRRRRRALRTARRDSPSARRGRRRGSPARRPRSPRTTTGSGRALRAQDRLRTPPGGHRASASSSTSIQWRTGVAVPLCRCWMQPMFAETIVAAPSGAR